MEPEAVMNPSPDGQVELASPYGGTTVEAKWLLGMRRSAGSLPAGRRGRDRSPAPISAEDALTAIEDVESRIIELATLVKSAWVIDIALLLYVAVVTWPVTFAVRWASHVMPSLGWLALMLGCLILFWPLWPLFRQLPRMLALSTDLRRRLFELVTAIRDDEAVERVVVGEIRSNRAPSLAWLAGGRNDLARALDLTGGVERAHRAVSRTVD
jgi:hypothetical protein